MEPVITLTLRCTGLDLDPPYGKFTRQPDGTPFSTIRQRDPLLVPLTQAEADAIRPGRNYVITFAPAEEG